jgi:hypothetical protein
MEVGAGVCGLEMLLTTRMDDIKAGMKWEQAKGLESDPLLQLDKLFAVSQRLADRIMAVAPGRTHVPTHLPCPPDPPSVRI